MENNIEELWKDLIGYEDRYQISNLGKIRFKDSQELKASYLNQDGYEVTTIRIKGKKKNHRVHRLVLETFLKKSSLEINHKNGIKTDNRVENLEYCTRKHNVKQSYVLGLKIVVGEKNPNAILNDEKVREIKEIISTGVLSYRKIGKMFNVSANTIACIKLGKNWKHIK